MQSGARLGKLGRYLGEQTVDEFGSLVRGGHVDHPSKGHVVIVAHMLAQANEERALDRERIVECRIML